MRDLGEGDVCEALEGVREAVSLALDALSGPYEALAADDPDAVIGAPIAHAVYASPAGLRAVATKIEASGRNAWALRRVEERESQVRELIQDYRRGAYSTTSASAWLSMVQTFREGVIADVLTAMQAPRGWDRIDLDGGNHRAAPLDQPVLSPKDVAPQLGLDEREVRRRIHEGRLGPWKKQGGRWTITREAFFRFWDQLASDADEPHPPGLSSGDASGPHLDHLHLS